MRTSPFLVQPFTGAQIYPIDLTPQKKREKLHEALGAGASSNMRSRDQRAETQELKRIVGHTELIR
jgi:hypothetical protein